MQGKFAEAEQLCERSQTIMETVLGSEHPDLSGTLHSRGRLLQAQVKADERFL